MNVTVGDSNTTDPVLPVTFAAATEQVQLFYQSFLKCFYNHQNSKTLS
jgi:hypothetical protein